MENVSNSFFKTLLGIIKSPGPTLGKLMDSKKWIPIFILVALVSMLLTYVVMPLQVDKMIQSQNLNEEQVALLKNTPPATRLLAACFSVVALFVYIGTGAFLVYLFYGIGGADGVYGNFFSITVNASLIDTALPGLINIVCALLGWKLWGGVNLGDLLHLEPVSFGFIALSKFGLFPIWYIIALAAGVAVFAKMKFSKSLTIGVFYFLFKSAVTAGFSYLFASIFHSAL